MPARQSAHPPTVSRETALALRMPQSRIGPVVFQSCLSGTGISDVHTWTTSPSDTNEKWGARTTSSETDHRPLTGDHLTAALRFDQTTVALVAQPNRSLTSPVLCVASTLNLSRL